MKSSRSHKSRKPDQAAAPSAPRVSLFDARGKVKSVETQGLRIDFPDGRALMFDLSGASGEASIAIVAQHADAGQRVTLTLRPEHYDSLTLSVGAEPSPEVGTALAAEPAAGSDTEPAGEPELELVVQYGDEIAASQRKKLPKPKLIAEWLSTALFSDAQLTVRFVGEKEGRELNGGYRKKDYPTNVLTFAYDQAPDGTTIGDLVLCCPVVEKEAGEQDKPLVAHYAHLLVHGALHAQGYDHERGEEDAAEMEALEIDILAKLGFPNPYL
ncbi:MULTISPECIES: rRNA maturation RNase YbeY [unclassified Burkholderia]|uniref:rRNA maturation RNase YbeY n=1 Tax=unclassified Burkholderia TaxID=2613784 RepID=UPI00046ABB72|nr:MULTISPECIES: rRNA maturation RNase YbeY [unclassified Burkholderia]NIE87990.1 rRNA maturation RNase YbeY [Burkholderia sp. Tr-860]NIF66828.1 rRNA maturation RNase YbeY [Burkholderia sp. Cy-647]NIF74868.1 rRNA maturation RNase YbeY [Burkholderia sp. Ap-962]NIF90521.1 rRNA maturation RNase YbeY [Burkholderia sp. Cy-637]NIF97563.1 rRNA maturation RNase YbeY [Burkholderia sp. Ax-1720]